MGGPTEELAKALADQLALPTRASRRKAVLRAALKQVPAGEYSLEELSRAVRANLDTIDDAGAAVLADRDLALLEEVLAELEEAGGVRSVETFRRKRRFYL